MGRSLIAGAKDRWSERRHFARFGDWAKFSYDRVLWRWKRMPLPGRGRVVGVGFRGMKTPVRVRLGTTDMQTAAEIYFGGQYDRVIDGTLGPMRTIVDLGANAGYSVALWRDRFAGCRVVAVEPDAANMAVCRRNSGPATGQLVEVKLVQACVAGTPRQVTLDRAGGEWAYEMREVGKAEGDAIDAIPLMQILKDGGIEGEIDLLKCNIEGAEAEVFAGGPEWVRRVRNMVVDVHKPYSAEKLLADVKLADGRTWVMERLGGNDHREMVLLRVDGV